MMNNRLLFIEQVYVYILIVSMIQITTSVDTFPQILTETHNQTLNLSSTAVLTCHVRDLGEHHITWFKVDPLTSLSAPLAVGRQLFTPDERYSISFYSTSSRDSLWSLEIYQLNLSDEGTYVCKIANRRASVSLSIHLHVQIPMTVDPTELDVEPGAHIQLNCTVFLNETNTSMITWHFASLNQINKTKIHDVHIRRKLVNNTLTSVLTINHTHTYHTGTWTCIYKQQRVSAKVIVEKDTFRHHRASAWLSNHSNRQSSPSINFFLFALSIICTH